MAALTGAPLPAAFDAPSAALGANTYVHTKDVPFVKLVTSIQQLFAGVGRSSWLIQSPGIAPEVPDPLIYAIYAIFVDIYAIFVNIHDNSNPPHLIHQQPRN